VDWAVRRVAVLAVCLMFATVMIQILARYVFLRAACLDRRRCPLRHGLDRSAGRDTVIQDAQSDAVLMGSVLPQAPALFSAFMAEADPELRQS
jgi:hypothetical protein